MQLFRLNKSKYQNSLSGIGAALYGGRWNSKGTEIIYTSESRALAMAEVAVHLKMAHVSKSFRMIEIEIPDSIGFSTISPAQLPKNWRVFPPQIATQKLGDAFIKEGKAVLLKVPSAVVLKDYNYLINPNHSDFKLIKVTTESNFPFDLRLF